MLYVLLILALIVILLLKAFRPFYYMSTSQNSYTWIETLNPFNAAPINVYRHLSSENKGVFWSLASSTIIGVLTCWLGFSVQFFVLDSTQIETQKLAHYQVVDKFRPMYLELFDSCSIVVFRELYSTVANSSDNNEGRKSTNENAITIDNYIEILNGERLSPDKEATSEVRFFRFTSNRENWDKIVYATQKCIDISASIAPYLDTEKNDSLLSNNSLMLMGVKLISALDDAILLDSVAFVSSMYNSYVDAMVLGTVSLNSNVLGRAQTLYSYYRVLSDIEEKSHIVGGLLGMGKLLWIPMVKNMQAIHEEFAPPKETNEPMKQSLKILFVSLLIGYMLFRVILMRCLDKKSLEPNPRLSQLDLDKLNKELVSEKKEKKQLERNVDILEVKIKDLSDRLHEEEMHAKDSQEKLDEMTKNAEFADNEIHSLRDKVSNLESIKNSLLKQIDQLTREEAESE